MNGFVVKNRVKFKICIIVDNFGNVELDKFFGFLVFVIVYFELKKLVNIDNVVNRWDVIKKLEQDFEIDINLYLCWGGDFKRVS